MKRALGVIVLLILVGAAAALAAEVRLGAELALGPEPQFPAGNQLNARVAYAAGHVLAVWTDSASTITGASFDGAPLALPSSPLVGIVAGRANFLVVTEQDTPDHTATLVLGTRVGVEGRVLDAAPISIVRGAFGFFPGGIASNGSQYVLALNAKPFGLSSVIAPFLLATGEVSEDGVVGPSAMYRFDTTAARVSSPRVAAAGGDFVIGYAVQYFSSFDSPPWGISAMPFAPEASAGGTLGTPSYPSLNAGGIDSRMAVGADRATFAWLATDDTATRLEVAQTDLLGRAIGAASSIATMPRVNLAETRDIEIAWDGSEYLVVWIASTAAHNTGPVRGIRLRYDGTPIDAAPFDILPAATASTLSLAVTSDGFLIAYTRADTDTAGATRALARTLARLPEAPRRRAVGRR